MRILLSLVALLSASMPALAGAASCAPKAVIEDALGGQFAETPFATGIAAGNMVKFFGNAESGSWTVVVVRPDGVACVVAQGENLELRVETVTRPSRLASLR